MKTFRPKNEFPSQPECNTGFGGAPRPPEPLAYCAEEELRREEAEEPLAGARIADSLRSRG